MPSFLDLQQTVTRSKVRRAILLHLVEYIDQNFRPVPGGDPRHALLTDDKQKVPYQDFEECIEEVIMPKIRDLDTELSHILSADFVETSATSTAAVATESETGQAPETPAAPRRRNRRAAAE